MNEHGATQLTRFLDVQDTYYPIALSEIQQGKKRGHWMWYIFPQIKGLGFSDISKYYSMNNLEEATAFLQHPVLANRLIGICKALLQLETNDPKKIFGSPDDIKLQSSMTLFAAVPSADPVFEQVLAKLFGGQKDEKTLDMALLKKDPD